MCDWGGLLTSEMRNMWSGLGPASSVKCPVILVLGYWSIGNDSPIALHWGAHLPPAFDGRIIELVSYFLPVLRNMELESKKELSK